MRILFLLIIFAILFACSTIHELHLKSDGSVYFNGELITANELKSSYSKSEIILTVDHDVPYDKVIELISKLKENGVKEVGLKSNVYK